MFLTAKIPDYGTFKINKENKQDRNLYFHQINQHFLKKKSNGTKWEHKS